MKRATTLSAALVIWLLAGPANGQANVDFSDGPGWLIGYVVKAPHQLLGIGTALSLPGLPGWGLYADTKLTFDSPAREDFIASMTPEDAEASGDEFFRDRNAWTSIDLAVVKGIRPEFALYLGGGVTWRTVYRQYIDESRERAAGGQYWVEDADEGRTHANVLGGAFFRLGRRIVFQFGAESAPRGFTAGIHLLLR